MYTSDTDFRGAKQHSLIGYGAATIFCFVFQLIYEHFSHGVTSWFMVLAFLIPLMGGAVSCVSFSLLQGNRGHLFRQFLGGGVIWLMLGSIFRGVLEIYGTTNRLAAVFAIAGTAQLAAAMIAAVMERKGKNQN